MKKRILALLLCIAALFVLLPGMETAADDKLNFIAINDTLPPELINTAVAYGGRIYVPYWLFANYGFGISYVYFSNISTVYLYSGDHKLFFELSTGKTYDDVNNQYNAVAIMQGGTIYLPLNFICSFFGLRYSSIAGNEYGSILRLTNGTEVMTDGEFLTAAQSMMQTYYQNYNKASAPANTPAPTPAPTTTPPSHEGDDLRLALLGLPDNSILEQLQRGKMGACFFLTAEDARSDPDLVRRLACSGYGLGVYSDGAAADYQETAALLQEIARVRTILCILPEEAATPPGAARLLWDEGYLPEDDADGAAFDLTAALEAAKGDMTVACPCGPEYSDTLLMVLYYLRNNGFNVTAPRVTDSVPGA